jgi:hypothetical protein
MSHVSFDWSIWLKWLVWLSCQIWPESEIHGRNGQNGQGLSQIKHVIGPLSTYA